LGSGHLTWPFSVYQMQQHTQRTVALLHPLYRKVTKIVVGERINVLARYMLSPVRLSARPSITRVDQPSEVEYNFLCSEKG